MRVNVSFLYHDNVREYVIDAKVHLGTTSARGDDPDTVLDLNMRTHLGTDVYMTNQEKTDLAELSIIEAKNYV